MDLAKRQWRLLDLGLVAKYVENKLKELCRFEFLISREELSLLNHLEIQGIIDEAK